jgi:methylthioxylose transferase
VLVRADHLVTALGGTVAVATVVAGPLIEAGGHTLGTATPPFVMAYGARLHVVALVAVAVAAAGVYLAPRLLDECARPAAVVLALTAAAAALALTVNASRRGTGAWTAVFDTGPGGSFEAANEYLAGLPALGYGRGFFLDRFAELVPALPVHVAGHPPGLMLTIDALGLTAPGGLAALCIAAAAMVPALTYALARTLLPELRARAAGALAVASPCLLLFGATSADAVYAALGTATAALLASRRAQLRAGGAVLLAVSALFSWALLAIGAWATVLAWRREGLRSATILATGCAVAVVALNGGLAAVSGYDPLGTLAATGDVYRNSLAQIRPYWFWVVGSPVAWGVMTGLAIAGGALASAARLQPAAVALAVVIAVAALAGFTKAETERIWLAFVPLACVAAAEAGLLERRARLVLATLVAQAIATQVLFDTVW